MGDPRLLRQAVGSGKTVGTLRFRRSGEVREVPHSKSGGSPAKPSRPGPPEHRWLTSSPRRFRGRPVASKFQRCRAPALVPSGSTRPPRCHICHFVSRISRFARCRTSPSPNPTRNDMQSFRVRESLLRMKIFIRKCQETQIVGTYGGTAGCKTCVAFTTPMRNESSDIGTKEQHIRRF